MQTCPDCRAGSLRLRRVTYAAWHTAPGLAHPQFMIVPQVPAWLCDICGAKLYDESAMAWLLALMGPAANVDGVDSPILGHKRHLPYDAFDGDPERGRAH